MREKRYTKDEQFLIRLYEEAQKMGDPFQEMNCYKIGQLVGQNDRSVDNIVRMLAQTNFLKKGEENCVYATKNGEELIKSLLLQNNMK
jgi:ribosome biogenesis protein Nip4